MLWTLLVGFMVGLLARMIKPGADSMGWILTIILGIAGAYVGSYLSGFFGISADTGFSYLIFSVLGAMLILFVYEMLLGRRQ